jgi:hypothetical protein
MAEQTAYPTEIQRDDNGMMRILWNDGHECRYTYEQLRKACPCATCRESNAQQQANPFNIIDVGATARLTPTHISAVGHYALNITRGLCCAISVNRDVGRDAHFYPACSACTGRLRIMPAR